VEATSSLMKSKNGGLNESKESKSMPGLNNQDIKNLTRAIYELSRAFEKMAKVAEATNNNLVEIYRNKKKEDISNGS
jgi:hypothetical protein